MNEDTGRLKDESSAPLGNMSPANPFKFCLPSSILNKLITHKYLQ
jgi:hypothetical protein